MRVALVTVFPEMLAAVADFGVTGRAVRDGRLQLDAVNPRDYTHDRHRSVDDRPYGGGPGMVMRPEPLAAAIDAACEKTGGKAGGKTSGGADAGSGAGTAGKAPVIYLSPQGRRFDDRWARELAAAPALVLVAGRYEGVDERVLEAKVDAELSIGDYVLSGGELAAMVVIDAVARLLPGVLGHAGSADEDSFAEGLLDCPHYTRPEEYEGRRVPEVLLSGDHEAIRRWRRGESIRRTLERRPDLLEAWRSEGGLSAEDESLLAELAARGRTE